MRPRLEHTCKCDDCYERKKLIDFPRHKQGREGYRNTCKVCHSKNQYQTYLRKLGGRSVVKCKRCKALMKRKNTSDICRNCRKKDAQLL